MAFQWKPAIYKSGTLTQLPRPVEDLKFSDEWDIRKSKVPLRDGETVTGMSFNGPSVSISGKAALQAGQKRYTEQMMFSTLKSLRTLVNTDSDSQLYEFFMYHDATTGTYEKLKRCTATGFNMAFGDNDQYLFAYSLDIVSENPVIYQTAPGA